MVVHDDGYSKQNAKGMRKIAVVKLKKEMAHRKKTATWSKKRIDVKANGRQSERNCVIFFNACNFFRSGNYYYYILSALFSLFPMLHSCCRTRCGRTNLFAPSIACVRWNCMHISMPIGTPIGVETKGRIHSADEIQTDFLHSLE